MGKKKWVKGKGPGGGQRWGGRSRGGAQKAVAYTQVRAHETVLEVVCRLVLEKKKTEREGRVKGRDAQGGKGREGERRGGGEEGEGSYVGST